MMFQNCESKSVNVYQNLHQLWKQAPAQISSASKIPANIKLTYHAMHTNAQWVIEPKINPGT